MEYKELLKIHPAFAKFNSPELDAEELARYLFNRLNEVLANPNLNEDYKHGASVAIGDVLLEMGYSLVD